MRYVLLFAGNRDESTPADLEAMQAQVMEWWGAHSAAGVITGGEQLQPANTATTVRHSSANGSPQITDGPYVEAKEQIGGFAVVDVENLDQALELARTWPARGTVEVRPTVDMR